MISSLERITSLSLYPLKKGHFWAINLEDILPKEIHNCQNFLDQVTLSHIEEYSSFEDRKRYLLTHSLIRTLLQEHLKEPPMIWRDHLGKPHLCNKNVHFNLSHNREWAFLGIHSQSIGVDIESLHSSLDSDGWLTPTERTLIGDLPIVTAWCAKEALLKEQGTGFLGGIPKLHEINPLKETVFLFRSNSKEVFVYLHQIKGQVLAVCVKEQV